MKKFLNLLLILFILFGCSNEIDKKNENRKKDKEVEATLKKEKDEKNKKDSKPSIKEKEAKTVDVGTNTNQVTSTKVQLSLSQSVQENGYYCVPACLQMVLRYKNIEKTQTELAVEMNTKQVTGTEYIDLARVVNKYLFHDESVSYNEPGYHIQTLNRYEYNPQIRMDFERRVKTDISTNDPVFAAIDVHALYPHLNSGNHMIVITGYGLAEGSDDIAYYYYIDPSYVVQDAHYGGLKIASREEMINAIIVNEEPAYIY